MCKRLERQRDRERIEKVRKYERKYRRQKGKKMACLITVRQRVS
jgi:hypothetical protein